MPYLRAASTLAGAVTFMALPGRGPPKDAVVIARANGATATTAFPNGRGPDGLAVEEGRSAGCPVIGEEASHDK